MRSPLVVGRRRMLRAAGATISWVLVVGCLSAADLDLGENGEDGSSGEDGDDRCSSEMDGDDDSPETGDDHAGDLPRVDEGDHSQFYAALLTDGDDLDRVDDGGDVGEPIEVEMKLSFTHSERSQH